MGLENSFCERSPWILFCWRCQLRSAFCGAAHCADSQRTLLLALPLALPRPWECRCCVHKSTRADHKHTFTKFRYQDHSSCASKPALGATEASWPRPDLCICTPTMPVAANAGLTPATEAPVVHWVSYSPWVYKAPEAELYTCVNHICKERAQISVQLPKSYDPRKSALISAPFLYMGNTLVLAGFQSP